MLNIVNSVLSFFHFICINIMYVTLFKCDIHKRFPYNINELPLLIFLTMITDQKKLWSIETSDVPEFTILIIRYQVGYTSLHSKHVIKVHWFYVEYRNKKYCTG